MFCIGFLSGSAFSLQLSLWSGGANLALHHAVYLIDLCRPVSGAQGSRSVRSAERGVQTVLVVSFARIQRICRTTHSLWRAIYRVLNDLPQEHGPVPSVGQSPRTIPPRQFSLPF